MSFGLLFRPFDTAKDCSVKLTFSCCLSSPACVFKMSLLVVFVGPFLSLFISLVDCCLSPRDFDICQRMGRVKNPTGLNPGLFFVAAKVTCDSASTAGMTSKKAGRTSRNSLLGLERLYLAFWGHLPHYGARNGVTSTLKSSLKWQSPTLPQ